MRVATTVEASQQPWQEIYEFVVEAEHLGLDICWVAEAWGSDAPSVLGFLAAWTDRLLLGSGVFQVGIRTPVTIAMTALTLARISDGRFLLGLGSTGPQVIEGLHGQSFASPLTRMRETIDVIRQALAGDKIDYSGSQFKIPGRAATAAPCGCRFRPILTSPSTSRRCHPRCWNSPVKRQTAGWEPVSFQKAPVRTSNTSTPAWPPRDVPARISTSARVPKSRSSATKTPSRPTSKYGRKN